MVAGPIGNLSEISERSKKILNEVSLVTCEDSRVTGKLLAHLGLKKSMLVCNAHNELKAVAKVLQALKQGAAVAYLSDAGTPGISDPGEALVAEVTKAGYKTIPVSGPSALTALLSVCAFNLAKGFYFAGFLPRTPGKLIKLVQGQVLEGKSTLIAFESPYRIRKTLSVIAEPMPDLHVCIGRELTKMHEQIIRGTLPEVLKQSWPEKGEFALALCKPKVRAETAK
jgi:16S rRNA (cytidine1402-2'-O)-methyltransferase